MSLTTFSDIPRSVLALLLDCVGAPMKMSPRLLMGEPATLGPRERAELYAGGFIEIPDRPTVRLTPSFVKAARVLLNPHTNLTVRIWGKDSVCGETNIQFPLDIMSGGGVILNQLGRMYRISVFADETTVTDLLREAVPQPKEQDLEFEFKALLDNTVAAVLFAFADLARARVAKEKKPAAGMAFNTQDIYSYMHDLWAFTGFKDLLTYVTALGIIAEPPSLSDTVDGLRLLVKASLLAEKGTDNYSASKALEPLIRLTAGVPSGVQWQRVALTDTGEQYVSNRLYLFGDKSFMLCIAPAAKGKIFISRVRRQEIIDFITSEMTASTITKTSAAAARRSMTAPPLRAATAVSSKAKPQLPPQKGQVKPKPVAPPREKPAVKPVAKPVLKAEPVPKPKPAQAAPRPAQPTPQAPAREFCTSCGAPLDAGSKFCTKCGTPVAKTAPAVCRNCGAPKTPGARFCTKCGTGY